MNINDFEKHSQALTQWIVSYFKDIESYPVLAQVRPGDITRALPTFPNQEGEAFEKILADFSKNIMPGITHWQHPKFFGYFPANSSLPCLLAETLTAALSVQGMNWLTSPAATELELLVMDWLREMCGLPKSFFGVIQDAASISTLVAMICARERATDFAIQKRGFSGQERFRIYCSEEAHSSVEKSATVAGFGRDSVRKIATDETFALDASALESQISEDKAQGFTPLIVVATFGTTSSTAFDPLDKIAQIAERHHLWLHVDGAYAGSALILPEVRALAKGIERADSLVFNPHKWLMTSFDCSAFFVRDKKLLLNTFSILPEYLKTKDDDQVVNLRDTSIGLGRRFRALKLWVVIRSFGVEGLQSILRSHIAWAQELKIQIEERPDFEILAPVSLNLICFRWHPKHVDDEQALNQLNQKLQENLNASGKMFLTHTLLRGKYTLRLLLGQTHMQRRHVQEAWQEIIAETSKI